MTDNLKNLRILVTPTSYGKTDPRLCSELEAKVREVTYNTAGRPLVAAELKGMIQGIDGYIAGLDEVNEDVIRVSDSLKVIARYGVGVDNVDLEAARAKGIVVTNTPDSNSASVAELTVGLILALARNIPTAAQATKSGEWPRMSGISLQGKVVGLLGFGSIGKQVARRLQGFDCTILAYDPLISQSEAYELSVQLMPRGEVIAKSDFLSLHCPLTTETRSMVDGAFTEKMKTGAYLINTARGELIEEAALLHALQEGKLRGAALDVFSKQPPDPNNALLAMPQIIATPHMGALSDEAINAMGWGALHDCLAVLGGELPAHRVV